MIVNLYTTLGCHLCDEAMALIQQLQIEDLDIDIEIEEVEIANSDDLMSTYGIRIPVVTSNESEGDIGWPFTLKELRKFLK